MRRRGDRGDAGDFREVRQRATDLLGALDRGEVAAVYLFSGEDDYQRHAVVRRVVAKLVPEEQRETCLTILDGGDVGARRVAAELESGGLRFGDEPRRVVLVRDAPFFSPDRAEESAVLEQRLAAGLLDDVTVVFEVRGRVDKRLKLTKTVLALGVALEFPVLSDAADVARFLESRLRRAGKRMAGSTVGLLTERCGLDAQVVSNEVEKLVAYVGDRTEITPDDVRTMVAPTAELSIFELVDAVAERQVRRALEQLDGLLGQQAEPFMLLGMLIRQFRLLLQARYLLDSGLAPARLTRLRPWDFNQEVVLGERSLLAQWREQAAEVLPTEGRFSLLTQHYFPLWKALTVAERLSAEALEAALERLLQTDLALKTSHLDPPQELELLVVDLCTRIEAGATVDYASLLEP